jgi:hypothetical protein
MSFDPFKLVDGRVDGRTQLSIHLLESTSVTDCVSLAVRAA